MNIHEIKQYIDEEGRKITCFCNAETGEIENAKGMFQMTGPGRLPSAPIVFSFEEKLTLEEYFEKFDSIVENFVEQMEAAESLQAPHTRKGDLLVPEKYKNKGGIIVP